MKIKYLGTAAAEGFPALFCTCEHCVKAKELGGKNIRTRSQAIIDDKLLIDLPADTYYHYLAHNINLPGVDNLLVTHSHADHFYPMELEMRCNPYFIGEIQTLNIYGNKQIAAGYQKVEEYEPRIKQHNVFNVVTPYKPFDIGNYIVSATLATHDEKEDCLNYIVTSKKDNKTILYAHDTGFYQSESWEYLKNYHFDIVSIDCTTGYEDDGKTHMGFNDTVKFKDMFLKEKTADENTKFIISHFSHGGRFLHEDYEKKAGKHNIIVAFDGLEVSV